MKKLKCPNCKYEWETKSKMIFVCCPCCMKKFDRNKEIDSDSQSLE